MNSLTGNIYPKSILCILQNGGVILLLTYSYCSSNDWESLLSASQCAGCCNTSGCVRSFVYWSFG